MGLTMKKPIMKFKFTVVILAALLFVQVSDVDGQWVNMNVPNLNVPNPGPEMGISCIIANGQNLFAETTDGSGVLLSTDSGESWTSLGLTSLYLSTMVDIGTNLLVGAVYGSVNGGIYISTNNGKSWSISDSGFAPKSGVSCFGIMDGNIFAASDYIQGLFRSSNSGTTWVDVDTGFPSAVVRDFAVNGSDLFAAENGLGVFFSSDSGAEWAQRNNELTNLSVNAIAINGTNLYVGTEGSGVFLSTNKGESWNQINNGLTYLYIDAFEVSGTNIFAGTEDSGVFLSKDSGASWIPVNSGFSANPCIQSFAIFGGYLFAGMTNSGVWRRPLSEMLGSSSVATAPQQSQTLSLYPNPVSHEATISFSSDAASPANVSIYNLLGSEVARLYDGTLDAGNHSFTWDASSAMSGAYMCVVRMNGQVLRVPLVVAK